MVLAALVTACRLAIWPTRRSPLSVKPTTVGVVRPPSLLGTICTAPPSSTATQQFVVPKSIPTTFPIATFPEGETYRRSGASEGPRPALLGDLEHRRADQLIAQPIAAGQLLDDGVRLVLVGRLC